MSAKQQGMLNGTFGLKYLSSTLIFQRIKLKESRGQILNYFSKKI